jgi:hypothetical protein
VNPLRRSHRTRAATNRKEISTVNAPRRLFVHLAAAALALGVAGLLPAVASAAPAPAWAITSTSSPTGLQAEPSPFNEVANVYVIAARNVGGAPLTGANIKLTDALPPGMTVNQTNPGFFSGFRAFKDGEFEYANCQATAPGAVCEFESSIVIPPGQAVYAVIPVTVPPALVGTTVTNEVTISGGNAPDASVVEDTEIGSGGAPGFDTFNSWFTDVEGAPETRAGSHPTQWHFDFLVNSYMQASQYTVVPFGSPKEVKTRLPRGMVVNPLATPVRCNEAQLETHSCPDASAVGVTHGLVGLLETPIAADSEPLYNIKPAPGEAASLSFEPYLLGIFVHLQGGVDTAGDYTLTADAREVPQFGSLVGLALEIWGNPSDPIHNQRRGECGLPFGAFNSCPVALTETPFLTMPTSCTGSLDTEMTIESWQDPANPYSTTIPTTAPDGTPVAMTGCNALDFEPTLKARPTTNVADAPSGLEVELHMPQHENINTLASAALRDTTVTLPPGMVINPASGNGLSGCSAAQIGLTSAPGALPVRTNASPASCPDTSKLGSVEVRTPLVDHPLPGSVYIANPYENPFGSLLAIYLTIQDPVTGVIVKLAGEVTADPQTGQLTTHFAESPQLPVEDFKLNFYGGAGGPLRTPVSCGSYATTSSLEPWSAPDSGPSATPQDGWAIEQGANGGACTASDAEQPNAPSFDAGTISPIAGAYSPLVVNLRRQDGTQQFASLKLNPPPGLVGKLAGIPYCSQAALDAAAAKTGREEEASQSCPQASYLGSATVGAGAGPAPYYAAGKAFLTGPYKGAPISLAIVTPATAGPFDLGTVVVRSALYVDPRTAQITAVSDPIPTILQGIPLDVRSIQVKMDRPDFSINPTSCDPMAFSGELTTAFGLTSPLQSRFQLGECGQLGLKPKLSLRLKGGTKRGKYPALTAVMTPRAGDANLASVSVALPHSEFLAQEHIGTVCTRVQFAADACPAESIYGTATVTTPLLDYPLTGNVYLRSSSNKLPDLVPYFRGPADQPIRLEADGRTDSVNGGIRNTFDYVPDAPFSKLTLQLMGGKKGLLLNSTNICRSVNKATAKYTAHNGLTYEAKVPLKPQCKKKPKKHKKAKRSDGRKG